MLRVLGICCVLVVLVSIMGPSVTPPEADAARVVLPCAEGRCPTTVTVPVTAIVAPRTVLPRAAIPRVVVRPQVVVHSEPLPSVVVYDEQQSASTEPTFAAPRRPARRAAGAALRAAAKPFRLFRR